MLEFRLLMKKVNLKNEEEHAGSIWKHPYMLYILLTTVLFVFLLAIGFIAWDQGWIPNRGISVSQ